MTNGEKGAIAATWLTNPVFVWGAVILMAYVALKFLLPGIYGGAKDASKKLFADAEEGFSDVVDNGLGYASELTGSPSSQIPAQRTTWDSARGVLTQGDRAFSDAVDFLSFGYL